MTEQDPQEVKVPTPQESEEQAYRVLLEFCVERANMYGMCNVNASAFSDSVILRVIKEFQNKGWVATCIVKNDVMDPSLGGVVSIRPPGEPPVTDMPEPMGMMEERGDDGYTEYPL